MRRRSQHASRRPLGAALHRVIVRLGERLAPRVRRTMQAGGRSLLSLGIGLVMLALIGLLLANLVGQVIQSARLDADGAALAAEVAALKVENEQLAAAVAFAESDVNVERIARQQLGYAREGDTVLLPQPGAPTSAPEPVSTEPDPAVALPDRPLNWRRWWVAFFPSEG